MTVPSVLVTGDLTVPESLDAALRGVGAVFLVRVVAPAGSFRRWVADHREACA